MTLKLQPTSHKRLLGRVRLPTGLKLNLRKNFQILFLLIVFNNKKKKKIHRFDQIIFFICFFDQNPNKQIS